MPTPKLAERLPGRQSLIGRLAANILNHDLVRRFGPLGASATVTYTLKPQQPLGEPPGQDKYHSNPDLRY